jgi:hypothetical protein
LETFVLRCPTEVTQYIDSVIQLCLIYLRYDPNYAVDEDEDSDEEDDVWMEKEEEESEEDEDDGFVIS